MKLELKHLAPYLPYGIQVQYEGILNGKELGEWHRKYEARDIFDADKKLMPEYKTGAKLGLVKKIETYLKHWRLRVGNGHKSISPCDFGKDAFLCLRPLSSLDKVGWISVLQNMELTDCLEDIDIDDKRVNITWSNGESHEYYQSDDIAVCFEGFSMHGFENYEVCPFKFREELLKQHVDVFGLIEKGLAIDINNI